MPRRDESNADGGDAKPTFERGATVIARRKRLLIPYSNQFPEVEPVGTARIAIIGESLGTEEAYWGKPFCGPSGALLDSALGHAGIARNQCYVGNVCGVQPPGNDLNKLEWEGEEIQRGVEQLRADLERFKPTIVLCLGNAALHLMKHGNTPPPRKREQGRVIHDWPSKISDWRGSMWWSEWAGVKCLAALHPAAVLREFSLQAYYRCAPGIGDFERLRVEVGSRELELPKCEHLIAHTLEAAQHLRTMAMWKVPLAVDIEGGPGNITSIAFSNQPEFSLVIPFAHIDGTSVWSEAEEVELWGLVKEVIEDASVPKVAMHGTYDFFALLWTYGITVQNWDDIEVSWWELFAELKKSLATQVSLLTKEPFYKPDKEDGELKFESDEQFWRYNGLDAARTLECWQRHGAMMTPGQREHYRFNRELFPAVLYMMARGIRVDKERVRAEQEKARQGAMELQARIDREAIAQSKRCDALSRLYVTMEVLEADEETFARLCLHCLGGKNPRVRVEVVEERWQPMRWNGKKWVKEGKLVSNCMSNWSAPTDSEPPDINASPARSWFKPTPRTVERLQSFTPRCLSDCEPHILESKRGEWKRVKQIWKELRANEQRHKMHAARNSTDFEQPSSASENRRTESERDSPSSSHVDSSLLGELSLLLGLAVNVSSTNEGGDAQGFLYETCGLPKIFKDERTGRYSREAEREWKARISKKESSVQDPPSEAKVSRPAPTKRPSTDQQALDKLYAETQDVRVLWCLQQRRLKKVVTDLDTEIDADGRLRASISLVKETGRMAESASPTNTGLNRQALNKDLRGIGVADEGCEMCQCDLEGADSWTVAAECAALGDRRMLEDLLAGMKPAKGLCFGYFEPALYAELPAGEIKGRLKALALPEWLYPGAKSCTHGTSYGMGWKTMVDTVLKYSMADLPLELAQTRPIVLTKAQVEKLQGAFLARYPGIKRWHEAEGKALLARGWIETSVGHVRRIYGRKAEIKQGRKVASHETLKEVLASKPQFYTTRSIKMALRRCWYDSENRTSDGRLRVEPLLCVHDSLMTQWKKCDAVFGSAKTREWFDNKLVIAGVEIVIPADGTRGYDWSQKSRCECCKETIVFGLDAVTLDECPKCHVDWSMKGEKV